MSNGIRITSTNSKTGEPKSFVRVYLHGKLIAEQEVAKRNPYQYLQGLKFSKHIDSLKQQITPYGLTLNDIGL